MTMSHDVLSGLSSRFFQPRIRFGPTFSCSGLDASGPIGDAQLSDQREQQINRGAGTMTQAAHDPLAPQLYGVLKTQMAWMHGSLRCGLRHQHADQVVGEEMHPEFLLVHLRGVAAQFCHLQGRLDGAQIQLNVPALPKQLSQGGFADLARAQQGGDDYSIY